MLNKFKFDKKFLFSVLKIAIPLMVQQLIVCSVNLLDNLMVGQLGDVALGGVATVNKFYMIAVAGIFGMNNAGGVFLAQFFGAEDKDGLKQSFRFIMIATVVLSFIFFFIGFVFPHVVLGYFTKEVQVIEMGIRYFKYATFTLIPLGITICISNAMRSIGQTKYPLIMSVVAVFTNTFLNYCLIFGHFGFPRLEIEGAAIATLIARIVEMFLGFYFLNAKKIEFNTSIFELFNFDFSLAKTIFLKALPLSINEILWNSGMATLFKFYATRGLLVMTGLSVSATIGDIFYILYSGMAVSTTVLVSQKLGANKLKEAQETAYKLLGVCFMLSWIFMIGIISSRFMVPLIYNNISYEAQVVAKTMLMVQGLMYWIHITTAQIYFILRSGGDMKGTLLMDSGFMWTFNIPVMAIVTYMTNFNYLMVYVIGQSTDIVKLLFSYRLLRKEKWVVNLTDR